MCFTDTIFNISEATSFETISLMIKYKYKLKMVKEYKDFLNFFMENDSKKSLKASVLAASLLSHREGILVEELNQRGSFSSGLLSCPAPANTPYGEKCTLSRTSSKFRGKLQVLLPASCLPPPFPNILAFSLCPCPVPNVPTNRLP